MAGDTKIEWADKVWNPVVGCSVVSPGCSNCFAMRMAARIERLADWPEGHRAPHYIGLTRPSKAGPVWTGKVALASDDTLTAPLRWREPKSIFVNSMGDLFHPAVPDAWIDRVFAVAALAHWHTFLPLTKRSARMRAYMSDPRTPGRIARVCIDMMIAKTIKPTDDWPVKSIGDIDLPDDVTLRVWPLPNVILGVSVEDQRRADERIPDLLATPAAGWFVSAEPLLGGIDMAWALSRNRIEIAAGFQARGQFSPGLETLRGLDAVIVGGESGSGARPMALEGAHSIVEQTRAAGVKCFVKQLGARPTLRGEPWPVKHRKGADMAEWPQPLRVQELPYAR